MVFASFCHMAVSHKSGLADSNEDGGGWGTGWDSGLFLLLAPPTFMTFFFLQKVGLEYFSTF